MGCQYIGSVLMRSMGTKFPPSHLLHREILSGRISTPILRGINRSCEVGISVVYRYEKNDD